MLRGLQLILEAINKDTSANVAMICSLVPRVFCTVADLKECKTMNASEVQFFVNSLRSTFSSLEALHVPTIAIIEGAAPGGGLEMALSCDLRICGEEAVFSMPETGLAIIPGPTLSMVGTTSTLWCFNEQQFSALAHPPVLVFRMLILGPAKSPLHVLIPLFYVGAILGLLILPDRFGLPGSGEQGLLAIRMPKHAIDGRIDIELPSPLELEEECYEKLLNTQYRLEGMAAFAEKRKPIYKGE
ncbi:probable enoyl-CoA hydratase 2, mitochondrial isoform X2 [Macadamia integrifolia]|uniref:probable enoyl-CoA hydratase 2, mitochondrial isoform X2 n=1 Tax=Macadamia integrifolia TaxID=60698 RepID=UPI001C4F107F|nr:probable enoyl-CoA hydratase 2, mitochondrial isoform X2 [Macadamia integrifolia]